MGSAPASAEAATLRSLHGGLPVASAEHPGEGHPAPALNGSGSESVLFAPERSAVKPRERLFMRDGALVASFRYEGQIVEILEEIVVLLDGKDDRFLLALLIDDVAQAHTLQVYRVPQPPPTGNVTG